MDLYAPTIVTTKFGMVTYRDQSMNLGAYPAPPKEQGTPRTHIFETHCMGWVSLEHSTSVLMRCGSTVYTYSAVLSYHHTKKTVPL